MILLTSVLSPLLKGFFGKIIMGTFTLGVALFAVGEVTSDRKLILCSMILSFVGVLLTAGVAFYGIRVSQSNSKKLEPLVALPGQVKALSAGIDGVAHELKAAKEEGSVAKQEAAHMKGQLEERDAERARTDVVPVAAPGAAPAKVEVVNRTPVRVKETP